MNKENRFMHYQRNVENLGRLVAIDSQLGTPSEGMPFGEGPAKVLEEGLKIAR